jgi:hypothetical protein
LGFNQENQGSDNHLTTENRKEYDWSLAGSEKPAKSQGKPADP